MNYIIVKSFRKDDEIIIIVIIIIYFFKVKLTTRVKFLREFF